MSDILNLVPKGTLHPFLTIKPSTKKMLIKAIGTLGNEKLIAEGKHLRIKKQRDSFFGDELDVLKLKINNFNYVLLRNTSHEVSILYCETTKDVLFCYCNPYEHISLNNINIEFTHCKLTREVHSIIPLINLELKEELHVTKDLLCL